MFKSQQKKLFVFFLSGLFFFTTGNLVNAHQEFLKVNISQNDGALISSFSIPTANLAGGASLTVADLGTDNIPEIIISNGLGNEPRVHVYRQDGSEIGSFLAYAANMGTGITVAACDFNSDGLNEIITSTQYGGGPQIRSFSNTGNLLDLGFYAYDQNFSGGVNIACGDIDHNEIPELVTGAGPGGGPHVRIWSWQNNSWQLKKEFFVFEQTDNRGVIPFIKKDGTLIVISEKGSVIDFVTYSSRLEEEKLSTISTEAASVVDVAELNNKIIFSLDNKKIIDENGTEKFSLESQTNGAKIFVADLNNNGTEKIISTDARPMFGSEGAKYITIDLSEQRLYAYENGNLANTFLISSAKAPFTTEEGIHSILAKLPYVDYTWNYGEGSPNNYSLGLVPWNLLIYPHHYIHYAWWHNNFGHSMSHGCVNVNLINMIWIYNWSEVGTPVEIRS
jgi:lipoprotein-anchoring transpeptidase ErfK/SrfK